MLALGLSTFRFRPQTGSDTSPGGTAITYARPDGTSVYRRPDGSSLYLRP